MSGWWVVTRELEEWREKEGAHLFPFLSTRHQPWGELARTSQFLWTSFHQTRSELKDENPSETHKGYLRTVYTYVQNNTENGARELSDYVEVFLRRHSVAQTTLRDLLFQRVLPTPRLSTSSGCSILSCQGVVKVERRTVKKRSALSSLSLSFFLSPPSKSGRKGRKKERNEDVGNKIAPCRT